MRLFLCNSPVSYFGRVFSQVIGEVHLLLLFLRGFVRDDDHAEFSSLCFPFGTGQLPGGGV